MSTVIQEAKLQESSDQNIQMQQLLPMRFAREKCNKLDNLDSIVPYATLRMRNIARLSDEECANAIAKHLQSNNKFMQDNSELKQFRMETVRMIPQCLTVKRSVRSQLLATVNQRTKRPISCWKLFKYNISLRFTKFRMTIRNLLTSMKLWHQTIKIIESHYGSGIVIYFQFLRWLLFLNIISCILSMSFIVIPQSLDRTHAPNDIKILDFLTGNALLERYDNKRTELYVMVIKNYTIAAIIIGTLFIFWIIHSTSHCWQTYLGEEIYRLIVLDFIASIFGMSLQSIRSTLYKRLSTRVGRPEFDIARSILNLIYNQTLFWIGLYFSPLISVIIAIKLICTFYMKRYELKRYYRQPSQPWRTAQTQTLFLALTFVSIIVILFTIGYIITNVKSDKCGPFRNYTHTWDFITDGILSLRRGSKFWKVVSELARPVTGAVILIGMSIAVYCLQAKAEASKEMLQILSDMVLLQSQDKQFLIRNFNKCVNKSGTLVSDEISLTQDIELTEQNHGNEKIPVFCQHTLPSTSFEEK
ncbi:transmembrane channel-like protein 5 isoform X3 [Pogonomyrmex barbatus]|uniref:Transmembrane channel-like protein 5 isoform X3 n=1 Tax=Pogonomyrmex barbatus TaxID=144034 RepID=A0A8N1S5S0_9HYME|nr:transmembrane channel-like protein 5 isoform X3 [Pogonomyrmex barbatus]